MADRRNNPLTGLVRWIRDQFVGDVPEDDALCAFDCKKGQCTLEEWETCDRRIHRAAGELMPPAERDSPAQARRAKRASS